MCDLKKIIISHDKQHEIKSNTLGITKIVNNCLRYLKTFKHDNRLENTFFQLGEKGKYIERLENYGFDFCNDYLRNELKIIDKINDISDDISII